MSTGRMERTGATLPAMREWKTGTSRVPAVARRILIAIEFNEDNVGLVDAALRMLSAIVWHLDRNRGVPRLALVLYQLSGERPTQPHVDRGGRAGCRTGDGAESGRWCRRSARLS